MYLFHNRPLFTAALSFLVTAVISVKLINNKRFLAILCILVALLFLSAIIFKLFFKHKAKDGVIDTVILCLVLSLLAATSQYFYSQKCFSPTDADKLEEAIITATIKEITYKKDNFTVFIASTDEINGEKTNHKFTFEYFGNMNFTVGDKFACIGNISPFTDGGISAEEAYDFARGATASVSDIIACEKLSAEKYGLLRALSAVRAYIQNKILPSENDDGRALIVSLLLGKSELLNPTIRASFRSLGISHILAISGMHISILIFGVQFLLKSFNAGKRLRLLMLIVITVFYVGVSGASASSLRASLMFFTVCLSTFARRDADSYTTLGLAVMVIMLAQPYSALDIGLWLSFLATFGVITALTFIEERKCTRFSNVGNIIANYIRATLLTTFFAFIFTLPLVCLVFGYVSTLTPIANLIFSILTNILMYLSFLIPVFFFSAGYIAICDKVAELIVLVASKLSDFKFAVVSVYYLVFIIATFIFAGYVIYLLAKNTKSSENILRRLFISFSLLIVVLIGCSIYGGASSDFLYLYQEDSTSEYIISKDKGELTVFDLSDASNSSAYYLSSLSHKNKINNIDTYVICHYSAKYATAIEKLSANTRIEKILLPYPESDDEYDIAMKIVEKLLELDIVCELYDKNEAQQYGNIRFIVSQFDDSKYSYILHVLSKDTIVSYLTPQVISDLTDAQISAELENSGVVIVGKHGGSCGRVIDFSFPQAVNHLIFSNSDMELSDEFLTYLNKIKKVSLFTSTKIK